ncbi:hypothetical protein ACTFIR_010036 [Dictyostelium discoideum]
MNSNNNNNYIPLYLQKYIIKILCSYINTKNKLVTMPNVELYRIDEGVIKRLMMNLALVSKEWFKTLSNNLTVSIDFNYKENNNNNNNYNNNNNIGDDRYSIIKMENIKTLKLHFDQRRNQIYEMIGGIEKLEIPIKTVHKKLKKLNLSSTLTNTNTNTNNNNNNNNKLFNRIIIRNLYFDFQLLQKFIDTLRHKNNCLAIENITIAELEIKKNIGISDIIELKKFVKKVIRLTLEDPFSMELVLEIFKTWSKSIQYFIIDGENPPNLLSKLTGLDSSGSTGSGSGSNGVNYFSNQLKELNVCKMPITIQELIEILKSNRNLINLSFNFCFDSLIYFLSTESEKLKDKSIKRCSCNSLLKFIDNNDKDKIEKELIEFEKYWKLLVELFSNQKSLTFLEIGHDCVFNNKYSFMSWKEKKPFPSNVDKRLGILISSIPNLNNIKFFSGTTCANIFFEIASGNQSITSIKPSAINRYCNATKYSDDLKRLCENFSHIQECSLTILPDNTVYFSYNKNNNNNNNNNNNKNNSNNNINDDNNSDNNK